jgi:hypothetical protein
VKAAVALLAATVAMLVLAGLANAQTITVSNTTDLDNVLSGACSGSVGSGQCFTSGAVPNTLIVNTSTDVGAKYTPTNQLHITSAIAGVSLTIQGPTTAGANAQISGASEPPNGGGTKDVFDIDPGTTVVMSNIDIRLTPGFPIDNQGNLTLSNSSFAQNTGNAVVKVENGASLVMANSSLLNNSTSTAVDVIGTTTLTNDTITGNHIGLALDGGTLTTENDLIISNASGTGHTECLHGPVSNASDTDDHSIGFTTDTSCGLSSTATLAQVAFQGVSINHGGTTQTDPIGGASVARNAGDNTGCPSTDQNGTARARTAGDACDVGAFEFAPSTVTIGTTLSNTSILAGASAFDTAALSGNTATAGGTVTYSVYTNNTCSSLASGLQPSGNPYAVTNGAVTNSDPVTFPTAGLYYWQAVYSGDANNSVATSPCTAVNNEQLAVQASPSITTQLNSSSIFATESTFDTAALSGNTATAGGTVTYSVYTNNTCTSLAAGLQPSGNPYAVTNGSVANSGPVTFPTAGTYYWQAAYSGDVTNQAATSLCNEVLTVNAPQASTIHGSVTAPGVATGHSAGFIATGETATFSSTLSGVTGTAGGTVTYHVYTDNTCSTLASGLQPSGNPYTVTAGVVPNSSGVTFSTGGAAPGTTYYWTAAYSGDTHNAASTTSCTSLTVRDPGTVPAANTAQLQTAVDTSVPGDNITLSSGNYAPEERLVLNTSLTIHGPTTPAPSGPVGAIISGASVPNGAIPPSVIVVGAGTTAGISNVAVKLTQTTGFGVDNNGTLTLSSDEFSQNSGVAVVSEPGSTLTMTNSTLVNNPSTAVDVQGTTTLVNDTITGNHIGLALDGGTLSTENDIVAFNLTGTGHIDCLHGPVSSAGDTDNHSIGSSTDPSCGLSSTATAAQVAFTGVGYNHGGTTQTDPISGASVARDTGANTGCPSTDQNGTARARTAGDPCDVGAFEFAPNTVTVSTSLHDTSILPGQSTFDTATLSGQTATAGGTVTYNVYTNNTCTTSAGAGLQPSGNPYTVTNGLVPNSDPVTFPSAGTFYWQASYSGDSFNASAKSTCTSETLIVKTTPSITTTLSASSIPVNGSAHDSSHLTGATATAGGTVTYHVYTDNTCTTLASGLQPTGNPYAVTNASPADSGSVTFPTSGTFFWQAVYSGDANNSDATSDCTTEQLTVTAASTSVTTLLSSSSITAGGSSHDTATLHGVTAGDTGQVTFTVYTDSACTSQATAAQIGSQPAPVTLTTGQTVVDSPTVTFNQVGPGTYYWQASYGGDSNNGAAVSLCSSEPQTVTKASPTIGTTLSASLVAVGGTAHDTAALTNPAPNPAGTVTYTIYLNSTCSTMATSQISGQPAPVSLASPQSADVTFNAAGTYYWQAVYSGDANNNTATSPCASEQLIVGTATPSVVLTLSGTSIFTGQSANGLVSLTGATTSAGGTVTYDYFNNAGCLSTGAGNVETQVGSPVTVTNHVVPNSKSLSFPTAGTFWWQAFYSGDGNNAPASSVCAAAGTVLTVTAKIGTTLTTALTANTALPQTPTHQINQGQSAFDTATLNVPSPPPGAPALGGSVTYWYYTDNACTTGGTKAGTVAVTATGAQTASPTVTFPNAGDYSWQAIYSGDAHYGTSTSQCIELVVNGNGSHITQTLNPGSSVQTGNAVFDTAALSGVSGSAGGTVAYTYYTDSNCTQNPVHEGTVQVSNGQAAASKTVTFSSAGSFWWKATYSGDGSNGAAASSCDLLTVSSRPTAPISATLNGVASPGSSIGPMSTPGTIVNAGNPLYVSSSLTFSSPTPTGSVSYAYYASNNCTGSSTKAGTVQLLGGHAGNSQTVGQSPALAPGTYSFSATYSGDGNYASSTSCTVSIVVQAKGTATLATTFHAIVSPSQSVTTPSAPFTTNEGNPLFESPTFNTTWTGAGSAPTPTGSVTYAYYTDPGCTNNQAKLGTLQLSNGTVPNSQTTSLSVAPGSPSSNYYFQATYSGDQNYDTIKSTCTAAVTVQPKSATASSTVVFSPTTVYVNEPVSGDVTLSNTSSPTGSVSYSLFSDAACTSLVQHNGTVTLSGGSVPSSPSVTFSSAQTVYWQAVYSGDANNKAATSTCQSLVINALATPSLNLTLHDASIPHGASTFAMSAFTGGSITNDATGTVTYTYYSNSSCSGSGTNAGTVTITNNGGAGPVNVPNSRSVSFPTAGDVYWQATYSGDVKNASATSGCEHLIVS